MKIVRVLNTNAVVSIDQEGRELIITGAGIGFKKKRVKIWMKHWQIKPII